MVMVNSPWAWPAAETVHFLGLSLSFGVLLAVNLRILGVMRRVPFADVHRLLPWGMLGFGANLITGMLFFIGQPKQYIDSSPFYWKVVFLMIAGANFLYLTVFKKAWTADADGWDASLADKAMAVSSLFAWLAVLYGDGCCLSSATPSDRSRDSGVHGQRGRRCRPGARRRPRVLSRSRRLRPFRLAVRFAHGSLMASRAV